MRTDHSLLGPIAGLLASVAWPHPAASSEPLTAWLERVEEAAQYASAGRPEDSERAARAALDALPAGEAAARARLALGIALREQGRFAEAAEALVAAGASIPGDLRWISRLLAADAFLYSGRPGAAAPLFAEAAELGSGALARRARLSEADALAAAGLAAAAARAYESFLAASPRNPAAPGARLALGTARRAAGDAPGAVAAWRQLWLEQPDLPEGRSAGEALEAWRAAGGPVPAPTLADRLERAERLLALARPRPALRELDLADRLAAPAPARCALLRALALLQIGRLDEAERIARGLRALPGEASTAAPGAEYVLARAAARRGRVDEATALYRDLARLQPVIPGLTPQQQRDLLEDAAYLAAWLHYDAGRYRRAVRELGRFLAAHPGSRRAEDARWFRAWSWYRLGSPVEADRALARLERGPLRAAALYWRARLAPARARQQELYRASAESAGDGWYGLLAASRLAALGIPLRAPDPPPARSLSEEAPGPEAQAALSLAGELLALGLDGPALAELDGLARGPHARRNAARIARLAELAGDAELPFRLARDHLLPTRRVLRWAHPLAYPASLPALANGFGVDPLLLLALARRESGFRPQARSGASAEGLLQLIPPTAERLATLLGVPRELADTLGDPPTSLAFGAYYLALLASRFPDPAVLAAAYNAGPAPAAAWAEARAGLPLDEWVEDIPYRETRQYVRIVIADLAVYRRLYGDGRPAVDPARRVDRPPPGVGF